MEYNTYDPSSDLELFIKCFWSLKVPAVDSAIKQQILPDGCMEMIFIFGDDIKRYTDSEKFKIQPRAYILGQISKPFFIEPIGEVDTFAVRFYPNGLRHFVNVPLYKLSDNETELDKIFEPKQVEDLVERISKTQVTKERISFIEEFLHSVLQRNVNANELIKSNN